MTTARPGDHAMKRVLRAAAKSGALAVRLRRKMLRGEVSEDVNWWELPLPKRTVLRAWYGSVPSSVGTIYRAPGWMSPPERLAVYAIVYGLRPNRSLEIGTFYGGSALIIVAALDDIGAGTLECVDPNPKISARHLRQIEHRATINPVPSPEGLAPLASTPAQKFDFALIDGDHSYNQVISDIEATCELLADDAVVLLHDAHYHEVADAINAVLDRYPGRLIDCGMVSTLEAGDDSQAPADRSRPVVWGGLRMLRWTGSGAKPRATDSAVRESTT
jgi:hypothetical protein